MKDCSKCQLWSVNSAHRCKHCGEEFVMEAVDVSPRPKSVQAAFGNYDRRTTWWIGYWRNTSIGECSGAVPRYLPDHDIVVGDDQSCRDLQSAYRYGGYVPISRLAEECLCKARSR